jgi:hypothetical protein
MSEAYPAMNVLLDEEPPPSGSGSRLGSVVVILAGNSNHSDLTS